MSTVNINYLFDRPRNKKQHPWEEAFTALAQYDDIGHRAIAENWQIDHRVAQGREEAMLSSGHFHQQPNADQWWWQRREYFTRSLCLPANGSLTQGQSAYAADYNSNNQISPADLPGHNKLLHVASLNRILWRLSSAEYATADLKMAFQQLTGYPLPERPPSGWDDSSFNAMVDEIVAELQQRGKDTVREVAGLLCDALGPNEPPWWAGFAMELHHYRKKQEWYQLSMALGLGHLDAGEWLLPWHYKVSEAGPLYRPTSVEANESPFHYPSPPSYRYGVTMPLGKGQRACREVIHPPLKGAAAREACTGELGRIADSPAMAHNDLVALRQAHRERLAKEHLEARDHNWLKRHPSKI